MGTRTTHAMTALWLSHRKLLLSVLVAVAVVAGAVVLLSGAADLAPTLRRIAAGDPRWLALALVFEALSFAGHIILFRAVYLEPDSAGDECRARIGMRESYQITLAGHAAARLFASAGAGGLAVTAWALRRARLEASEVAARMIAFLAVLYGVYMAAVIVGGVALWAGLVPGGGPLALTVVPATNTLPLPGGVGGVEGGMIGAFVGFGVDPTAAIVAVLAYRVYAFWLPTVPGVIAYLQLRRTVRAWGGASGEIGDREPIVAPRAEGSLVAAA